MAIWEESFDNNQSDFSISKPFESDSNDSVLIHSNDTLDDTESPSNEYDIVLAPSKIIAALVGGVVGGSLCERLYTYFLPVLWTPLMIALFMLVLMLCITIPVMIVTAIRRERQCLHKKRDIPDKPVKRYCLGMAVLFLLTMVLEIIYELNFDWKTTPPTSYIFSLDTSGSMESTDSNHELTPALNGLVQQIDEGFPFSVYAFNSYVSVIREMAPRQQSDLERDWTLSYNGGTELYGALQLIYDDYMAQKKQNIWSGGASPKVILMSDGDAHDVGMNELLTKYQTEGIVICTVGTGQCNKQLLEKIALMTGGVFIYLKDVSDLHNTMQTAAETSASRNLLSDHYGVHHPRICGLLRIVFLTLIGLFMIFFFHVANGVQADLSLIIIIKVITALVAAITAEAMLQGMIFSSEFSRFVFCILTALIILHGLRLKKKKIHGTNDPIKQYPNVKPDLDDKPEGLVHRVE